LERGVDNDATSLAATSTSNNDLINKNDPINHLLGDLSFFSSSSGPGAILAGLAHRPLAATLRLPLNLGCRTHNAVAVGIKPHRQQCKQQLWIVPTASQCQDQEKKGKKTLSVSLNKSFGDTPRVQHVQKYNVRT
jgi:hypothetical protein